MYESNHIIFKTRVESRLKATKDVDELKQVMLSFVQELGFSDFDFSSVGRERNGGFFVLSSLDDDFKKRYLEQDFGTYDMMAEYLLENTQPMFQSRIFNLIETFPFETERLRKNKKIREMLDSFEYRDALSIPLHHGNNGRKEVTVFSVFSKGKEVSDFQRITRQRLGELNILANSCYNFGYKRLCITERPGSEQAHSVSLSPRQIEVLQQFAIHGSCSKRVGKELSISNRTIEKHAQNIRKILGVNTTYQAVVTGMKKGLIRPIV